MQVLKDNGEVVKRGDLLVRLDDTSIRESLQSAEAGARAAQQAFEQAQRQVERLKTLQAQGMTSVQALDDAEGRRNAASSELVAARGRVVSRAAAIAPHRGARAVRRRRQRAQGLGGRHRAVGKELVKVIDPRSMRFEGLVSADRMGDIKLGPARGLSRQRLSTASSSPARWQRVDAAANAVTRQVAVLVDFDDAAKAPRVAGLYAEGRIEGIVGNAAPMLAEASIVKSGSAAHVWRVGKDGKLEKVAVQLGERDARSGELALKGGLDEGDVILRNPGSTLVDGQKVEFAKATAPAAK